MIMEWVIYYSGFIILAAIGFSIIGACAKIIEDRPDEVIAVSVTILAIFWPIAMLFVLSILIIVNVRELRGHEAPEAAESEE